MAGYEMSRVYHGGGGPPVLNPEPKGVIHDELALNSHNRLECASDIGAYPTTDRVSEFGRGMSELNIHLAASPSPEVPLKLPRFYTQSGGDSANVEQRDVPFAPPTPPM